MSTLETMMPPVKRATVNGIELAWYEAGPREGVPIVLCHGFPELAFSWRHQIKALGDAGRWVIAPDQRGYGLSAKPASVTDYDIDHLTGDLVGLLDHLGVAKAIFVGHDWGGIVAWQMPLIHPSRVAGVIGLNTPFIPRAPADPIAIMRKRFGPDMYIVWFQNPDEPEAVLGEDTTKTMRFFMRRPAALAATAGGGLSGDGGGASTFAFRDMLRMWDGKSGAEQLLSPEELAVFADAFRDGGFFITAELDAVLSPEMAEPMVHFVGDLETHMVKGSGHWTQQEKPEDVNRLMLDWLDRRFPK